MAYFMCFQFQPATLPSLRFTYSIFGGAVLPNKSNLWPVMTGTSFSKHGTAGYQQGPDNNNPCIRRICSLKGPAVLWLQFHGIVLLRAFVQDLQDFTKSCNTNNFCFILQCSKFMPRRNCKIQVRIGSHLLYRKRHSSSQATSISPFCLAMRSFFEKGQRTCWRYKTILRPLHSLMHHKTDSTVAYHTTVFWKKLSKSLNGSVF